MSQLTTGKHTSKAQAAMIAADMPDFKIKFVGCYNFRAHHDMTKYHSVPALVSDAYTGRQMARVMKKAGLMTIDGQWID